MKKCNICEKYKKEFSFKKLEHTFVFYAQFIFVFLFELIMIITNSSFYCNICTLPITDSHRL